MPVSPRRLASQAPNCQDLTDDTSGIHKCLRLARLSELAQTDRRRRGEVDSSQCSVNSQRLSRGRPLGCEHILLRKSVSNLRPLNKSI